MKKLLTILILATALTLPIRHVSAEFLGQYPLDQDMMHDSFSSGDTLSVRASCLVKKNGDTYSYKIVLGYKAERSQLLSWNYLDWILNQYPNAIKRNSPWSHLFPIQGKGEYVFEFESKEPPLWYGKTKIIIFDLDPPNAKDIEHNKEIAENYSGVRISSYGYRSQSYGLGFSACLPRHLRIFTYGRG